MTTVSFLDTEGVFRVEGHWSLTESGNRITKGTGRVSYKEMCRLGTVGARRCGRGRRARGGGSRWG